MESTLALLVFLSPLIGFIINGSIGNKLGKTLSGILGTTAVLVSFIASVILYFHVKAHGGFEVTFFKWIQISNLNIDFSVLIDHLSVWMMLIISGIGTLIHLYSIGYMHEDEGFSRFFAYLNLFVFSMFLLVMGGNFIVLFFGWEGVGLCSYLLIGFWFKNVEYGHAARKAFIMNRIGDLGLLLGIFLIYKTFGSVNYNEIQLSLASGNFSPVVLTTITMCLFVGAMGKSAQIPLYTWLPDAMAGPTPVSALIHAATMVTAGIYLVVRNATMFELAPFTLDFILYIGLATSLFAAIIGLFQDDIKKVLAYSTVSQLGLMFVALGVGAYTSAMFHLTTHAFFKALLFLGAGSVIHAMSGEQNIKFMGGLKSKIKTTHLTFLIGTLAIIGFPFLAGFFSKDEILEKVFAHSPVLWALTVLSSAITVIYMLRLYFMTFWGSFRGTESQKSHLHESPLTMTLPLMVLAVLSVIGGYINIPKLLGGSQQYGQWIQNINSLKSLEVAHHEMSHSTELGLMGFAVFMVLALLFIVYTKMKSAGFSEDNTARKGFALWGENKFYVDECYQYVFVKPLEAMSDMFYKYIEPYFIQPIFNSGSKISYGMGNMMKYVQNGNIEYYILYISLGIVAIITLVLLNF